MFGQFMEYYDNPPNGFRSELAPTGLFLGYAGAIAAFVLPAMGGLSSASQTLTSIQSGMSSTIEILAALQTTKGTTMKNFPAEELTFYGNYLF